jgi:hypothetical protein
MLYFVDVNIGILKLKICNFQLKLVEIPREKGCVVDVYYSKSKVEIYDMFRKP